MAKKILNFATFGLVSFIPGKAGKIIRGAILIAAGVLSNNPGLIMAGVSMGLSALKKKPRVSANATDRLTATFDPNASRKIWLGLTAGGTDVQYQAPTGDDQEFVHWIMVNASHEVKGDLELWFDTEMAWSHAGGVVSKYDDYLTVEERNPGTNANGIAIDSKWTDTATLTGCAYLHIRYKRTGADKKHDSPFAQSLPSRVTVRGRGALLPDLREGGVSADDQTTWDWFDDDSGRNPAWQLLFYLIGWRINGKLAVGRGIPASRIDLESFITAANFCDETVALEAGGTEPRYRSDGLFGEDDPAETVIGNLTTVMHAVLRDTGGLIGVYCLHNDLATPIANFDDSDIIADDPEWLQTPDVGDFFNIVRGRYVDPSDEALYQMRDYREVEIDNFDGIDRADPFDLAVVQSPSQAQRLAKMRLQRNLYRGEFSATFGDRAWQVGVGDIVTLSLTALGWPEKLFRVSAHSMNLTGSVQMTLSEENAALYAWDAEDTPPVVAAEPTVYDWRNSPLLQGIDQAEARASAQIVGPAEIVIECDTAGAPLSDELDKLYRYLILEDGEPLSADVTWSRTTPDGITTTIDGTGALDLGVTALDVAPIEVTLTAERLVGPPVQFTVTVRKHDAPPQAGGSSGSAGGTAASQTADFTDVSSGSAAAISGELSVTVGTGASVALSVSLNMKGQRAAPEGDWYVRLQWYRWNGSTWAAIGSNFASTKINVRQDAETLNYYNTPAGSVGDAQPYSSSNGATERFKLYAWITPTSGDPDGKNSTNTTKPISFSGQIGAQG